ncbi:MAG: ATP synthase F1 subunit epsilon [Treponema sp.]|jgi:F-type H+-transporting ATPase subunit epsilon|nr:ATP synthase F1 subunit epsilon [Treponema sp.]
MAALFSFEVHTPYRLFYSTPVAAITLPLVDGEIGVYANHSFFTAPVCTGILKIKDQKGQWLEAFITEGILEVKGHKTVLLVDAAEWPDEIDYDRALAAKERAETLIKTGSFRFETDTARASLKRAEFRIKARGLGKRQSG